MLFSNLVETEDNLQTQEPDLAHLDDSHQREYAKARHSTRSRLSASVLHFLGAGWVRPLEVRHHHRPYTHALWGIPAAAVG